MDAYFIGIEPPSSIKGQLRSCLYGLPSVKWVEEENLLLLLRHLGPLPSLVSSDVEDALTRLSSFPFSIKFKGLNYSPSRKGEGTLWIGIEPLNDFLNLKKRIDQALKECPLILNESSFKPRLVIGECKRTTDNRLADYLMAHSFFCSDFIEISSFTLFRLRLTPKRTIHEPVRQYSLAPLSLPFDE